MKKYLEGVDTFHKVFKVYEEAPQKPTLIPFKEYELRHRLMEEENDEYQEACDDKDIVGVADALGDQLYILCGTILKHGLQHKIEEVFTEISESNMSKLDENGLPILREDGKILKGKNYYPPKIDRIVVPEFTYQINALGKYVAYSENNCGWHLSENPNKSALFTSVSEAKDMVEEVSSIIDISNISIEKIKSDEFYE